MKYFQIYRKVKSTVKKNFHNPVTQISYLLILHHICTLSLWVHIAIIISLFLNHLRLRCRHDALPSVYAPVCIFPEKGHNPTQFPSNPPKMKSVLIDMVLSSCLKTPFKFHELPQKCFLCFFFSLWFRILEQNFMEGFGNINCKTFLACIKLSFICPHTLLVAWLDLEVFSLKSLKALNHWLLSVYSVAEGILIPI